MGLTVQGDFFPLQFLQGWGISAGWKNKASSWFLSTSAIMRWCSGPIEAERLRRERKLSGFNIGAKRKLDWWRHRAGIGSAGFLYLVHTVLSALPRWLVWRVSEAPCNTACYLGHCRQKEDWCRNLRLIFFPHKPLHTSGCILWWGNSGSWRKHIVHRWVCACRACVTFLVCVSIISVCEDMPTRR